MVLRTRFLSLIDDVTCDMRKCVCGMATGGGGEGVEVEANRRHMNVDITTCVYLWNVCVCGNMQ